MVIPPSAHHPMCPTGRAVFAYGAGEKTMSVNLQPLLANQNEPVSTADIDKMVPDDTTNTVPVGGTVNVTCFPFGTCIGACQRDWTASVTQYQKAATDAAMVRMPGGDILYAGLGDRLDSPGFMFCATPAECSCNNAARNPGAALILDKSSDCGDTWQFVTNLDAQTILNGRYADHGFFDRQELLYDHYSDKVFMTVGANGTDTGGNLNNDIILLRSDDHGQTWPHATVVAGRYEPAPMTSTEDGLYIALCDQATGKPMLYWSEDGGGSFHSSAVPYMDGSTPVDCGIIQPGQLLRHISSPFPSITLSRGPHLNGGFVLFDTIRVAYSSIEQVEIAPGLMVDRAALRVVNVNVPLYASASLDPVVLNVATIRATTAASSIIQASFVETDRFEFTPAPSGSSEAWLENAAALSWLEVPSSLAAIFPAGGITARWAGFGDFAMVYPPSPLSVSQGQPYSWLPVLTDPGDDETRFVGHDATGVCFHFDDLPGPDRLFFLMQWPQSDQHVNAGPNLYLHYNVASLYSPWL